jgi:hypothetical protein
MKHRDSAFEPIKAGDIILFDNASQFGLIEASEAVFVYNGYFGQYGFSFDAGAFLPYEMVKHAEATFYKVPQ